MLLRLKMILLLIILSSPVFGQSNWAGFRGNNHDGCSDATDLPLTWSENLNICWKTPIHDRGWSSPVVLGDQIWLTTATANGHELFAVCVDLQTGNLLHDIKIFKNENPQHIHGLNSYATPTPVIEKDRVYVHFGSFGTACLNTTDGTVIWKRRDLNCEHMQGPASSPILYKNLLILHLEGTDVQFITALNKQTGETVWTSYRPRELYQDVEPVYRKAYTTPIIITVNGKDQMISNGAQLCSAFDPNTGKEIWRVVYGYDSTISMPMHWNDLVYVNIGLRYEGAKRLVELWAVRPDGNGDVTTSHVMWKAKKNVPGISSPLVKDGLIYMVEDKGMVACLDAASGKVIWQKKLRGDYNASPIYGNERVYFFDRKGKTTVMQAGRECEVLAENNLDGEFWASPAVAGKSLILRTDSHLYRVEKNSE